MRDKGAGKHVYYVIPEGTKYTSWLCPVPLNLGHGGPYVHRADLDRPLMNICNQSPPEIPTWILLFKANILALQTLGTQPMPFSVYDFMRFLNLNQIYFL